MNCPFCHTLILPENINISADIARCMECESIFKISENLDLAMQKEEVFDIENPPEGAWVRRDYNGLVIGASTRSVIAVFLVPFMLVWSGGAIGGIYGTQFIDGEFNLLLSLFGIPFILASVLFWAFTFMCIAGKVEITLDDEGGAVFTGVGNIGFTKKFIWDEIQQVKEGSIGLKYPGSKGGAVMLEGKKRISFASGVKDERRFYIFKALQWILSRKKSHKKFL